MSVGGFLGSAQLGYYSMAFRVAELPYWAITEPVAKVTFPGFARMRHRGESVTASFLSVLRLVALVACPTGVLLSATAEPFTVTVFGSDWLPMIGVLSILGVWGTLNHIEASIGWLMNSVGRAGLNAGTSAATLPAFLLGVILAAMLGDIEIVAWVLLAHVAVSLLIRMCGRPLARGPGARAVAGGAVRSCSAARSPGPRPAPSPMRSPGPRP